MSSSKEIAQYAEVLGVADPLDIPYQLEELRRIVNDGIADEHLLPDACEYVECPELTVYA